MLEKKGMISFDLSNNLQAMVSFRDLAAQDYQELNLDIVQSIIEKILNDFKEFTKIAIQTIA